jgi:hypothetical protein
MPPAVRGGDAGRLKARLDRACAASANGNARAGSLRMQSAQTPKVALRCSRGLAQREQAFPSPAALEFDGDARSALAASDPAHRAAPNTPAAELRNARRPATPSAMLFTSPSRSKFTQPGSVLTRAHPHGLARGAPSQAAGPRGDCAFELVPATKSTPFELAEDSGN